jgi:glycine C-acetyltransferase
MTSAFITHLSSELAGLKSAGLYKSERVIVSKQAGEIEVASGAKVLNFCANNYLGLADNAELIEAGKRALDRYGYGMASVRFICGTQEEHKQLEARISSFLGLEDTILYSSCFDANGGLFETLLNEEDARSSPMRSTTPRSSTACGSPRPNVSAMPTTTWRRWRKS